LNEILKSPDGVSATGGSQVVDLHDTTVLGDPGEPHEIGPFGEGIELQIFIE